MLFTQTGIPVTRFNACGTKPFQAAGEVAHTVEAKIDLLYPEVPFPSNALYKSWGEANIRNMVLYHHTLLRNSAIGSLFPSDDAAFASATERTADFFVEALGGERHYTSLHGHPALRMRHIHITIDEKGREIWLMMYKKTVNDLKMPRAHIKEFWNWIEPLSIRMVNRRTTVNNIARYRFVSIWDDPDQSVNGQ